MLAGKHPGLPGVQATEGPTRPWVWQGPEPKLATSEVKVSQWWPALVLWAGKQPAPEQTGASSAGGLGAAFILVPPETCKDWGKVAR